MAFTKVVSVRSYVACAHLMDRWRHNGRVTIWHFYVFDFNESPAGECFSLPAPSSNSLSAQKLKPSGVGDSRPSHSRACKRARPHQSAEYVGDTPPHGGFVKRRTIFILHKPFDPEM